MADPTRLAPLQWKLGWNVNLCISSLFIVNGPNKALRKPQSHNTEPFPAAIPVKAGVLFSDGCCLMDCDGLNLNEETPRCRGKKENLFISCYRTCAIVKMVKMLVFFLLCSVWKQCGSSVWYPDRVEVKKHCRSWTEYKVQFEREGDFWSKHTLHLNTGLIINRPESNLRVIPVHALIQAMKHKKRTEKKTDLWNKTDSGRSSTGYTNKLQDFEGKHNLVKMYSFFNSLSQIQCTSTLKMGWLH